MFSLASLTATMVFAQAVPARPGFPALRLARHFEGEEAINALGENLPAVAAYYRKTPEELRELLRREHGLRLDNEGRLYYVCNWLEAESNTPPGTGEAEAALAPLDQTFLLHSRPGSSRTIFLDFDGFTLSGLSWNTSYNGGADIVAPPWDTDGNPASFGSGERTAIQQIWQRVAEDYAPYDVDVTTELPSEAILTRSTTSDQVFGTRALVSAISSYFGNYGGISYVGVFDDVGDRRKPSLIFPENLGNSAKNIAEAISHEVGHALGLSHDGTTNGSTYYSGQGNWAPIMGVGYSRPITQWSKGEYSTANNTQDDLTVITQNGVSYRSDDFGNTISNAAILAGSTPATNGIIERGTDVDFFRFQAGSGSATLTVAPASLGANLHLFVTLYNSLGSTLTNREVADTSGGVQTVVISRTLTAGTYFLSVEGRGSGSPATTGYSDYASLGQYTVNLSLPPVPVLAARPLLKLSRPTGSTLPLQFVSQSNRSYVLQAATNLSHPIWQNISTNIGNGGVMNISAPFNSNMRQRFWRLAVY